MSETYFCSRCGAQMKLNTDGAYCPNCGHVVLKWELDLPPAGLSPYETMLGVQTTTENSVEGLRGVGEMKTEQEMLKMFYEFDEKYGVDRTPNYTVKIGNKYVKSLDYSKENGWTYETSDEPVWMSKINAECVITDVIEFIDNIPNENEVTFEVRKMKTINEILENYKDYGTPFDDRFGARFCHFLTPEQMEKIGFSLNDEYKEKHVPKEWTEENVIEQLKQDVLFGWEKAWRT